MTFSDVVARLETALRSSLPGQAAHRLLAPYPRPWPEGFDRAAIRDAAGLLLIFPVDHTAHILLTVRGERLERHRGQVSLPGGVAEPGETFTEAALREAHEETGLDPAGVRVLGALTPVEIPVSGFRLHPIVGAIGHRPPLTPASGEVARLLDVPLETLGAPERLVVREHVRDGATLIRPAFEIGGVEIWGATAMVLAEFLTMLGWKEPGRVARTAAP